ncbi:MAG: DUF2993 domain-containing protein [Gomphosphaeria aponina SAG 52.96 = DSM 107014]|uniref:DUF2993 domain-containing protein n=1 Tax=Gomphosphaeria aponina SAG 52.96 = DSM 107014 TaxID=1521640 RepID=A0A941GV22_9CHRO|nr:DUF2993 domain-containing protein [Gomphosphaeria aponina SAG 52.96 = DSM 107014]
MRKTETKIISKILSQAIQLWLKTQVELVMGLELKIQSSDRQLLQGYIPTVFLQSHGAVYQGIHVGDIDLTAENIRVNLGAILKGKPLNLLAPIKVTGKLLVAESQLRASLSSPLLSQGLNDLFTTILKSLDHNPKSILQDNQIYWSDVTINQDKVTLIGNLNNNINQQIMITMGLALINSQVLHLDPLCLEGLPQLPIVTINDFAVDFGPLVDLQAVNLTQGKLSCCGGLQVMPAPEI